ncbi:MAG: hypothetical protein CFH19_01122 [Alphaproteobacteria bacterium MarineAlpha5_Bin9]|nr:MAG: hypothetical protein CFH19_01122 [Alphaproteobacteria bacterium MarineAlpha5_Bin9]|tara:strand:+ start:19672 stop:20133 length:462 start_codon:yes stop_codon:yes gene_type:complete
MIAPDIKGNPLKITVYLLVISYLVGEFILPSYPLLYLFNLIGVIGLITSVSIFFMAFNLFKSYDENPAPPTETNKLIKTGVFAYTRNPIYLAFIFFHLSMFLLFENVMYFLSSVGQAIWLHNWVVLKEEEYLESKMQSEYIRYKDSVRRWMFF